MRYSIDWKDGGGGRGICHVVDVIVVGHNGFDWFGWFSGKKGVKKSACKGIG